MMIQPGFYRTAVDDEQAFWLVADNRLGVMFFDCPLMGRTTLGPCYPTLPEVRWRAPGYRRLWAAVEAEFGRVRTRNEAQLPEPWLSRVRQQRQTHADDRRGDHR